MHVAVFGGASEFVASRSARDVAASRRQCFEDRVEALHSFFRAANHHAIAAFQSPDAAAGADVDVVYALGGAEFGAANVIFEIRVATVDDGVARLLGAIGSLYGFFGGSA